MGRLPEKGACGAAVAAVMVLPTPLCPFVHSALPLLFPRAHVSLLFMQIRANLFRSLPIAPPPKGDPDEGEQAFGDPQWHHLSIIYELLLRLVSMDSIDLNSKKKLFEGAFVKQLLALFDSEDIRERHYLKVRIGEGMGREGGADSATPSSACDPPLAQLAQQSPLYHPPLLSFTLPPSPLQTITHRIYSKLTQRRALIRRVINHMFFEFIYETERQNGIAEMLEILASIINGFAVPIKEDHRQMLVKALLPLHKCRSLAAYHPQLSYCMALFVAKEHQLTQDVVPALLRVWPYGNASKQMLFLNELEDLLSYVHETDFPAFREQLALRLAKCISGLHFQVSERTLMLWNSESFVRLMLESPEQRAAVLPYLFPALYTNASSHWHETIRTLSLQVLDAYHTVDPALYDRCKGEFEERVQLAAAAQAEGQAGALGAGAVQEEQQQQRLQEGGSAAAAGGEGGAAASGDAAEARAASVEAGSLLLSSAGDLSASVEALAVAVTEGLDLDGSSTGSGSGSGSGGKLGHGSGRRSSTGSRGGGGGGALLAAGKEEAEDAEESAETETPITPTASVGSHRTAEGGAAGSTSPSSASPSAGGGAAGAGAGGSGTTTLQGLSIKRSPHSHSMPMSPSLTAAALSPLPKAPAVKAAQSFSIAGSEMADPLPLHAANSAAHIAGPSGYATVAAGTGGMAGMAIPGAAGASGAAGFGEERVSRLAAGLPSPSVLAASPSNLSAAGSAGLGAAGAGLLMRRGSPSMLPVPSAVLAGGMGGGLGSLALPLASEEEDVAAWGGMGGGRRAGAAAGGGGGGAGGGSGSGRGSSSSSSRFRREEEKDQE